MIFVFYDVFKALCDKKGVSCRRATMEMGLSASIATSWKRTGAMPKGETLHKIADYFGVSVDYLLGTKKENAPASSGERKITFDDFSYAMYEETKDLPHDKRQMLLEMARFLKADLERDRKENE